MAVIIPQVITEDRASGAQVVEGSLRFDDDKTQYLRKAFTAEGNRRTFTWSCWLKLASFGDWRRIFTCEPAGSDIAGLAFRGDGNIDGIRVQQQDSSNNNHFTTSAVYRDNAWYHVVMAVDTTIASPSSDRIKVYVNGELQSGSYTTGAEPAQNSTWFYNSTSNYHEIGRSTTYAAPFDGHMTQCYWIDGQQLGPEEFGFTDGLTNTWRPKKYTGTYGTNGFYLPMDGSAPIGQDQSGNGNDWTPVNFGGSQELPKATGAIPILNTNDAGTVAKRGVRTDKKTYIVTASGGNYYLDGALKPTLNAYRGGSYTFDYTGATSHPFYLSSLPDGKHNSKAYSVEFDGSNDRLDFDLATGGFGSGDFTLEYFFYQDTLTNYQTHFGVTRGTTGFNVGTQAAGNVVWYDSNGGGSVKIDTGAGGVVTGRWYHIAFVRSGSTITAYLDGVSFGTYTSSVNYSGTDCSIGSIENGGEYTNGKISNFRINVGTAIYTSNFTPPQTTLSNVTNTVLLCCQDNDATTAVVKPGNITANGGAAATQTHQPFLYNSVHGNFGVNTATSNTTKITIPHLAADTLYYYCNAHSGMGSSINVTTDIRKADPYAWKNIISMSLNNATDESGNINVNQTSQTVTNSSTSFTGLSNFYKSTASFSRSSANFLSIPDSAGIELGRDDFTIEFWLYLTNTSNHYEGIISKPGNADAQAAPMIYKETSGNIHINFSESGSNNWNIGQFIGNCAQLAFKWHHVAVTRAGNTFRWFLDGVMVKTQTSSNTLWNNGNPLYIGKYTMFPGTNTYGFDGYLQDFRFYKGVAKYLGNIGDQVYVPASTAPDILPDTPSGIASKTNLSKITEGAVAFGGSADYLNVPKSTDFDFPGEFTMEGWIYANSLPFSASDPNEVKTIFESIDWNSQLGQYQFGISSDNRVQFYVYNNANTYIKGTTTLGIRRWYHLAVSRDSSNDIRLFVNGILENTVNNGYSLSNSNQPNPARIGRTKIGSTFKSLNGFISNVRVIKGTALYTSNFTPPTEPLTNVTNTKLLCCQSTTSATAAAVTPGSISDSASGYAFNRVKLYSVFGSGSRSANYTVEYSDDNSSWTTAFTGTMSTSSCGLVTASGGGGNYGTHPYWRYTNNEGTGSHHPRMARLVLSDGTTDVNIQTFTGDNCSDQGTIPGNGTSYTYTDSTYAINNASATNFNPFTDDINAIRGQESGYCTWNPLTKSEDHTLSNGNLDSYFDGSTPTKTTVGTLGMTSGKFYWESTLTAQTGSHAGIGGLSALTSGMNRAGHGETWMYTATNGNLYHQNSNSSYGDTYAPGDVIGSAFDADNGTLEFYKNGISQGTAATGLTAGPYYPAIGDISISNTFRAKTNFGQKPFEFPPPDGFQPLSLSNVQSEKVIARPDQYVSATLYNGTGNTGNNVSVGFKPDLVWVKRTTSSNWNFWFDSQRGPLKWFTTNERADEYTNTDSLTSFDNDGFTVGEDPHADSSTGWNINGQQHIAWCWKAGGGKVGGGGFFKDDVEYASAAAAGLTAGNVTPTSCSIGTDPGLSIIRYTSTNSNSALIPHGLGRVPKFLITKKITPDDEWIIHHTDGMSNQQQLYFNTATAAQSNSSIYHSEPTADTFAMGTWAGTYNMITYAFCDVPGFSKFGVYEGTNNPTGAFVELGFRPAVVIIKNLDESWYWTIFDSTRDTYNGSSTMMNFTTNSSQNNSGTYNVVDFISNGFKIRGGASNSEPTNNAVTYIYAAWAEAPSINLYGGQSNAR